jgi:hypothetical protein
MVQGVWQWSSECDGWTKEWSTVRVCWSCSGYWCSSASRQTCEYCSIGNKVQSFSRHHLGHCWWTSRLQESLLQLGSLSTDWWTQKDMHWIIPDVSSALWGAWRSILKQTWVFHYTSESKAESMNEPGSILTLQSKRSSRQCSLQGKWWLLFSGMFKEFFWLFHTSQFNNKCSCLSGNFKETQGGYSAQETRIADQRTRSSSFARQCSTSQCCCNRESLNSCGWEILPHPPYSHDLIPSDFHLFPNMKMHLRGQCFHSNEDVQNEVKKWLHAKDTFFSIKDLTNWYITMISV